MFHTRQISRFGAEKNIGRSREGLSATERYLCAIQIAERIHEAMF